MSKSYVHTEIQLRGALPWNKGRVMEYSVFNNGPERRIIFISRQNKLSQILKKHGTVYYVPWIAKEAHAIL